MYTYIYMYIYIYRILLNKFVLYTMAIYTTVSLRRQCRPCIFAHFPTVHWETKRQRKREGGEWEKKKETVPLREIILSRSRPPSGRMYIRLKGVLQRRFVVRKPRRASNTVPRRWKRCTARRRATPEAGPSAVYRKGGIWRWGDSATARDKCRRRPDGASSRATAADADEDWRRGTPPRRPRDRRRSYGYVDAAEVPPTWRIACRSKTRRRSNCRRKAGRWPTWTDRTTTGAASGPTTTTPWPGRTFDDRTECNRSDSCPRPSWSGRCAYCTGNRCNRDPCRPAPGLRRRPESWRERRSSTDCRRSDWPTDSRAALPRRRDGARRATRPRRVAWRRDSRPVRVDSRADCWRILEDPVCKPPDSRPLSYARRTESPSRIWWSDWHRCCYCCYCCRCCCCCSIAANRPSSPDQLGSSGRPTCCWWSSPSLGHSVTRTFGLLAYDYRTISCRDTCYHQHWHYPDHWHCVHLPWTWVYPRPRSSSSRHWPRTAWTPATCRPSDCRACCAPVSRPEAISRSWRCLFPSSSSPGAISAVS